jgi:site-specific DNA recombinase
MSRHPPIVPRNGHTLIVGIVARISGCGNQTELSLEDQIDHAKDVVAEMYDGPTEFRVFATVGKGEDLSRPELEKIESELRKRELDLFFSEDLGRIVRGAEAVRLLGIGVDHGVIGLSPDDAIDTRDPDWEQNALEACREHVAHNSRTSWRLQQKLMNRLVKFGGAPACPIVGYIVPEEARTYNDWLKDESLTAMLNEGLAILKRTLNGEAVAEFFNKNNMPVGPYCRRKKWDGRMALRLYRNDLLGGMASGSFLSER